MALLARMVVLILISGSVAGCLSDDAEPLAAVDLPAVIHRGGADVGLPAWRDVMGDAPLPAGTLRYTGIGAFEPTMGVTSDGVLFLSSYDVRIPDWGAVARSRDGVVWEDVTPRVAGVSFPPQSNDPYVYVDPDTDRVFVSDLQGLTCSTLSFSDDAGDSWTMNPVGCGHPVGGQDHQTVFAGKPRLTPTVGYPNLVYYCVNRVADSACAVSPDGGMTFGPLRPLVYQGVEPTSSGGIYDTALCGGLHAHGATGPEGRVYIPKGHCGIPTIAVSDDDGLSWTRHVISDVAMYRSTFEDPLLGELSAPAHEVPIAVDDAGNVYAVWIGEDRLPYFAASSDYGQSWTEAISIAPPGVATTDFPSIAASGDGRAVAVYYGTDFAADYPDMDPEAAWHGYMTTILDATGDSPLLATTMVNDADNPLARGICGGTRCNGVGDFIDIVVGPDGRPWAGLVDVCSELCNQGEQMDGSAASIVATLDSGPSLTDLSALSAIAPPLPDPLDETPDGVEVFSGTATRVATANDYTPTFFADDADVFFAVRKGASALVFEMTWDDPLVDLTLTVWPDGGTEYVLRQQGANDGPGRIRVEFGADELPGKGHYRATMTSRAAVLPEADIAVSVFYGDEPADDYTGI